MSRAPSWDCSFRSCHLLQGLSTLSDQHRFFPAHPDLRTGGRQHSTSPCHTQRQWIRGEWSHRRRAPPLLPAVKPSRPSGAPWARWVSRPSNCRRQPLPSASHTIRRVRTRRVRTTARPRLQHRFLRFRCRACWPSNAGQAPCTEDTAASDGKRDLHHSTRRSLKRISRTMTPCCLPHHVEAGKRGPGQSHCSSLEVVCATNLTTPDTRRMRYATT
jgi:hypothetical protein